MSFEPLDAHLGESDISRLLPEALTADVQAVFADETGLVCADAAVLMLVPHSIHDPRN